MFQFRTLNDRIDDASTGVGEVDMENQNENLEDEVEIIRDQDETSATGSVNAVDEMMGGMGTEESYGLDSGAFARGEIDLSEQMARTTASMEKAGGRLDSHLTHVPHKKISNDDAATPAPVSTEGMRKGHSTGALTDIGEGRSGVTRST